MGAVHPLIITSGLDGSPAGHKAVEVTGELDVLGGDTDGHDIVGELHRVLELDQGDITAGSCTCKYRVDIDGADRRHDARGYRQLVGAQVHHIVCG